MLTGMPMKSPAHLSSHRHNRKRESGFTLIEMAIVLVIVGIVISIIATVLPSLIQSAKIRKARAILEKVDYAIQGYSIANSSLPFADSGTDGRGDSGTYVGNLPYLDLGLSSGDDVWQNRIKYGVYDTLTTTTSDDFCTVLAGITSYTDSTKIHTTNHDTSAITNQAYIIVSGGPKDLDDDGVDGFFDGYNEGTDVQFDDPARIESHGDPVANRYDDLMRALSINELNQKNCTGGGSGSGGGPSGCDGVESVYCGNCDDGKDNDSDGLTDCDDPDCATHPECVNPTCEIATASPLDDGNVNDSYSAGFTTSDGCICPCEWELINNGGFTDFYLHPYTGHLSGTLSQCPKDSYTIRVKVTDSDTPPNSTEKDFTIKVTSNLSVARTSGDHSTNITWDSPSQEETFETNGGHLGDIDWTLDTGGATGFSYVSTGADTCKIKKNGSTTAGTYTFTLTAKDHDCSSTNTANIVLTVEVTEDGAGAPNPPDAEWRMDECSWNGTEGEVTDSSETGSHPGTSKNGAFTIGTGKICRCASTDTGSAYVLLDPVLDIGNKWTIAAWFYWPLASTGSGWWTLTRGTNDHQILVQRGSNLLGTYDNKHGTGWHSSGFNMSSLSDGWHHIAAVGHNSQTDFYIDATLKGTADYKSNTDIKTLGNYIGGNQNWGKFDELKVWNKALTEDEISQEYAATRSCDGAQPCYSGPVAEYRMENFPWNGTPGEVVDSGSGESHGVAAKAGSGTLATQTTPSGGKVCRAGVFTRVDASNGGYLDFGDPADGDLDPGTDPWTVSAWIKWDGSSGENIIYNKENLYEARVSGGYVNYAWQPYWYWVGGTSFPVTADTWAYVTTVYDGHEQILYKDGVRVYSRSQTGAIGTNSSKLLIGARGSASPRNFFGGMIDEVKIYNRALADNEIKADMEETRDCSADTVVITTTSLPDGTINSAYSYTLEATGGTTPYGWELVSSGIPGLSIVPNTGELHGTTDVCAGDYNITVKVTDAGSRTDERTLSLTVVNGTLTITPSAPQTFNCTTSTFYQDFSVSGPRLDALTNWAITWLGSDPGGFEVVSTGDATAKFRKIGTSTAGTGYQFKLTANDSVCNDNTMDSAYSGDWYTLNVSGDGTDKPYYAGMVGEWHMDECAWDGTADEVSDASGTNAHGESHNMGPGDDVNRSVGKVCYSAALNLDTVTDQYVTLGHEAFQNLDDFSLSLWFRIEKLSSTGNSLFSGASSTNANTMLAYLNSAGTSLSTYVNGPNTGRFNLTSVVPGGVADGLWHHLVWTRSGGTEIVYLDTNPISDSNGNSNTDPVTLSDGGAIIGQEQDSVGGGFDVNQVFHGWIDEIMVYNKVLTQTDVNNLYSLTHECVGTCYEDAIAEYRMDEDSWTIDTPCVGDSIGSYTGTARGHAAIKTDDPGDPDDTHLCNCGRFSNNDSYVEITGLPVSISDGDKTTVCFWMKWDGNTSDMPIGWGSKYDLYFWHDSGTGEDCLGFNTACGDVFGVSGAEVLKDSWHHIAAVFTNKAESKNQLYIDGVLQPVDLLNSSPCEKPVSSTFYISGWDTGTSYKYDGLIDELRIYTRGLSASEVADDMNRTHSCPGGP